MIQHLFFDLDGTLYQSTDETQKLVRARTAALVSAYTGLTIEEAHLRFDEAYQRTKSGSAALEEFGITDAKERMRDCLDEAGIEKMLKSDARLKRVLDQYDNKTLHIITDCRKENTEAKLLALGVRGYFARLFCWDTHTANKKNGKIFEYIEQQFGNPKSFAMIGDSEGDDILIPAERGWTTVHVNKKISPKATFGVNSIYDLGAL
jgi:HAD superfamily hydrolase (TIGR01549 family)